MSRPHQRLASATKPVVRWGLGHRIPMLAMRRAARRGDLQGRLVALGRAGDPFLLFDELRDHQPFYAGRFALLATAQPVVREVLSSPDFRAGFDPAQLGGTVGRLFAWSTDPDQLGPLLPPSLLVTEPPDHTRYRKLVTRVFSVRAVERLRVRAREVAGQLLDDLAGQDDVELVAQYCALLPVTLIAEILGVPGDERAQVLEFGAAAAPSLDLGLGWRQFRHVETTLRRFDEWLGTHLARLRRQGGDDLLSQLVAAREDGIGLTERELKATVGLVLAAGFETTVNLLGNGTALLRRHPDQLAALQARPEFWANAVDEILRLDPPVLLTGRTAVRDTEVAGRRVAAGTLITTILAAANRDPAVFDQPARLDVTRPNAREHVSFSAGRHYCLGAALARMEGEVGLSTLFERYPGLALLPGATRRTTRILRGYETLPVRLAG